MTQEEKKQYILQNWRISSGRRISEMLRRYWGSKKIDAYGFAEKLFNGKN